MESYDIVAVGFKNQLDHPKTPDGYVWLFVIADPGRQYGEEPLQQPALGLNVTQWAFAVEDGLPQALPRLQRALLMAPRLLRKHPVGGRGQPC